MNGARFQGVYKGRSARSLLIFFVLFGLAACGSGSEGGSAATPTATSIPTSTPTSTPTSIPTPSPSATASRRPTPTPTAEPTATPAPASITYRLIEGYSTIFAYGLGLPSGGLSGTFVAVPSTGEGIRSFGLVNIALQGPASVLTGTGEIALLPTGGRVALAAALSINGEPVVLNGQVSLSAVSDDYPPTFAGLEACGAPHRAVTCGQLGAGTAAGYELHLWAAPEATQTPLPTRTPTPTLVVAYRLQEGSNIEMTAPTPGTSPVVEPLSGVFVMRVVCTGAPCFEQVAPNTLFHGEIIDVAFQSPGFTITGSGGGVDVISFEVPPREYVSIAGLLNGEPITLNGSGPFDTVHYPPEFKDLEVCGGANLQGLGQRAVLNDAEQRFCLTINAAPER